MTPHHVMSRLASYFQVLWLEPAHHWRELRVLSARRSGIEFHRPGLPPGFDIYVPEFWLFDINRPSWLQRFLLAARTRQGWRRLRGRGCTDLVLYLWHYQFEAALRTPHHQSLYHIDDEYSFSPHPPPMSDAERRVIGAVDQVFAISPRLLERKGGINPRTEFAPEGVDYRRYATPVPAPEDIASIPPPRIGYSGWVKVQLDWPLLRALAARHPEWSFVFVGPERLDAPSTAIVADLRRMPNVHFLGPKSVKELAAYPQHFDACIMPYLVNDYTHNIYPLKLHEYLASGKPVIGSPIRTLLDFREVVALASTLDDWSERLAESLTGAALAPAAVLARQTTARRFDWSELTFDIARTICERLGPQYAGRLRKLVVDTTI
jgi:glycosyltransferase involved in cell wall biosynthesis